MKKVSLNNVCLAVAVFVYGVAAVQPNKVETTTYDVDGTNDVVTTLYSDGLARGIQSKLKLNSTKDRVTCTFYDEAGRPKIITKSFVDDQHEGEYLPGDLNDAAVLDQLKAANLNDDRAYSETEYWDDPLGTVKSVTGPGTAYAAIKDRSWVFGVEKVAKSINLGAPGTVQVSANGFFVSVLTADILDALTTHLQTTPEFTAPAYFLTVSKDRNDKFAQQLKDLFGRTLATRADPDVGTANDEIVAEYAYDITGKVLAEIPPKNNTTTLIGTTRYTYNTLGQVIAKTAPDGSRLEYAYYPDGNVRYVTTQDVGNPALRKLIYTYDSFGRPTTLKEYRPVYPSPISIGGEERDIAIWLYDKLDAVLSYSIFKNIPQSQLNRIANIRGRPAAVIYSNYGAKRTFIGELYSYDDDGRLKFKLMAIEGVPGLQETRFDYDKHGKVIADECLYNGESVRKEYGIDALGRLSNVYHVLGSPVQLVHYDYNDLGFMTVKDFSAISGSYGVAMFRTDIRDVITGIVHAGNTPGFDELLNQTDSYDNAGNVKKSSYEYFATTSPTPTYAYGMTYGYDDVYRLKTATPANSAQVPEFGTNYTYDQAGRFIAKQEGASNLTGYEYYNDPPNQKYTNRLKKTIKNGAGEEYVYDEFGNLIFDYVKKLAIEYDWRDMPVTYRFYNALPAGLSTGGLGVADGSMYEYVDAKVNDGTIQLASTVVMVYDAAGNRICKMDVKE